MRLRNTTEILVNEGEDDLVTEHFEKFTLSMEHEGLRLYAKSPLFHAWAKDLNPNGPSYHGEGCWAGLNFFPFPEEESFYQRWDVRYHGVLFLEGKANLCWLFEKRLGAGFEILLPITVSPNNFEDYFFQCTQAIQEIYVAYMRKATASATFSEVWGKEKKKNA